MRNNPGCRAEKNLLIAVVSSLVTLSLHAQTYNETENYGSISLGQGNAAIVGTSLQENACAPVAVANGLSFLYSLDSAAFTSSPNSYTAVNQLITAMGTGTTGSTAVGISNGVQNYLGVSGSNPSLGVTVQQNSTPTALSLNTAMAASDAVQLGILWGTTSGSTFTASDGGGGHFFSVTSIAITNGTGTMTILDPWGVDVSGGPGSSAASVKLSVTTQTLTGIGTVLFLNYGPGTTQPADNTSVDGTGATSYGGFSFPSGYVALDEIEAVPEPSTIALMAGTGIAWFASRRRKA